MIEIIPIVLPKISLTDKINSITISSHKLRNSKKRYGNCEWCSLLGDRFFIKIRSRDDGNFYILLACQACLTQEPWHVNPKLIKLLNGSRHAKHTGLGSVSRTLVRAKNKNKRK